MADSSHVLRALARIGTIEATLSCGVYDIRVTLDGERGARPAGRASGEG